MLADGDRSNDNRLSFDLPCTKKSLARAREKIRRFAVDNGFETQVEDIQLATQEAIKNVIQHACPADNNIRVDLLASGDSIEVEVSDMGMGFDADTVMRRDKAPMAVDGRGFVLMEGLMDTVGVTSDSEGTVVRMEKSRGDGTTGGPEG